MNLKNRIRTRLTQQIDDETVDLALHDVYRFLNLRRLDKADDDTFWHDVWGLQKFGEEKIRRGIFVPRTSKSRYLSDHQAIQRGY